eukprot:2498885-Ditylum_brightwellii.AAC.1
MASVPPGPAEPARREATLSTSSTEMSRGTASGSRAYCLKAVHSGSGRSGVRVWGCLPLSTSRTG